MKELRKSLDKLILNFGTILSDLVDSIIPEKPPVYTDKDVEVFMRDLKLKILIEGDLKPDINRLSKKEIEYLRKISDAGMVVIGSHVLRMYGILERKSGDIDVICSIDKAKVDGVIKADNKVNESIEDYEQDKDEVITERIKVEYLGRTLDIFDFKAEHRHEVSVETDGIVHSHYMDVLPKKLKYHREKDNADFVIIKENLNLA